MTFLKIYQDIQSEGAQGEACLGGLLVNLSPMENAEL